MSTGTPKTHNSAFFEKWWEQFGKPVSGNDSPYDEYWSKLGARILWITPSTAAAMLFAMVFEVDRTRARRGLDALRKQYKQTHPSLASFWGQRAAGGQVSLGSNQCVAIALAATFKFKKVDILKAAGLVDDTFNSAIDKSKFLMLDRVARTGKRFDLFLKERVRLEQLPQAERDRTILSMLKRIAIHRRNSPSSL